MSSSAAARWVVVVWVAVFAAVGCGSDDERAEEEPAPEQTTAPEGTEATAAEDPITPEPTPPADVDPLDRLAEIASSVADSGFSCDEPGTNESPDSFNRHSASMRCWNGGSSRSENAPAFSVYLDDPDPYEGEPCTIADHPFTEGMDVWQAQLTADDVHVRFEAIPSMVGSPDVVITTVEDFAVAAGLGAALPTCQPPV